MHSTIRAGRPRQPPRPRHPPPAGALSPWVGSGAGSALAPHVGDFCHTAAASLARSVGRMPRREIPTPPSPRLPPHASLATPPSPRLPSHASPPHASPPHASRARPLPQLLPLQRSQRGCRHLHRRRHELGQRPRRPPLDVPHGPRGPPRASSLIHGGHVPRGRLTHLRARAGHGAHSRSPQTKLPTPPHSYA